MSRCIGRSGLQEKTAIIEKLSQALGTPSAVTAPEYRDRLPISLARWRHGDAELRWDAGDAVTVGFHVSGGQRLERFWHGVSSHIQTRVSTITVPDPEDTTRYQVQGKSRIFHMYIKRTELEKTVSVVQASSIRPRLGEVDRALERCATRALIALSDGEETDMLLMSSIALRLSIGLVREPFVEDRTSGGGLSPRQLKLVRELIASRLAEPESHSPSLDEMAMEVNLSVYHFAREFRRTLGRTPHAYVLRQRLEKAQSLLAQSEMLVAEVGRRTGFSSPAHFAHRFRLEIGVAPSNYRRAIQN